MQATVEVTPGGAEGDGGVVAADAVAAADTDGGGQAGAEGAAKRLLMFAQGYEPGGGQVLSVWSDCSPGSMVATALARLRAAGWFDGGDQSIDGDPALVRRHAIAGAVMLSVASIEGALLSAGAAPQACRLLLDVLLDGSGVPDAAEWDRVTEAG